MSMSTPCGDDSVVCTSFLIPAAGDGRRERWRRCDHDGGWAKQSFTRTIAFLEFVEHCARRRLGAGYLRDCVVHARIKRLAFGLDRRDCIALQLGLEKAQDQFDAIAY
jgi:hypothetical protein